jgi:hypothetical protein
MKSRACVRVLSIVLLSAGWLFAGNLSAANTGSDGYSIEDFRLHTAQDLVDVCTLSTGHEHYDAAIAFCYGFFEGATHYDDAIATSMWYSDIVCTPPDVTREQAVAVFIEYMETNSEYASGPPIDGIFRGLIAKWPCAE